MALTERVAVVLTVKNDAQGCAETLRSLRMQTQPADEIIVVDGGSTDGTTDMIREFAKTDSRIHLIDAPNANIARGRNLGTQAAAAAIIATTDAGCRTERDWLEQLTRPFAERPAVDFVAGFYRIEPHTLLESVAGLCTMRGQLDPVDPQTFNASGRSMAYRKSLWARAGGWPEWIHFSEDTLYSRKIRAMGTEQEFAAEAVVHWRPRTSLRSIARQFYNYGTGRGHTRIGSPDFLYNLRNLFLFIAAFALGWVTPWAIAVAGAMFVYFYVWTFHERAVSVTRHTGRIVAYPLTFVVMWVVLFSNLAGYLRGSLQRVRDRERFEHRLDNYTVLGT